MKTKQLLSPARATKTIAMSILATGLLLGSSSIFAQVKIGSNPTVIGTNQNLEVEDASGTKTVVTRDKGFVGIGTDAPISRLHVHESIPPVFGSTIATFVRPGNKLFFLETAATQGAYNGLVKEGDSHFIFSADGDPATTANAGLVIAPWSLDQTNPGLKVMENGNVGIGTSAPIGKLSVFGGVSYFGIDPAPNFGGIATGTSAADGIGLGAQNGAASDGSIYIQRSGNVNYSPLYLTRNATLGSGPGLLTVYYVSGTNVGSVSTNGATTFFNTTSDIRLKENIKATHYGLSDLMKIKVADYNYKSDPSKKLTTGFIAQELYKIFPEAVTIGGEKVNENPWVVDYSKLTPLLVKAIQDQQAQITSLKTQLSDMNALREEVASIKALLQINKETTQEANTK